MLRNRRVGTLTTGIVLVIFGGLFIARNIFPALNYILILSLWPLILIILGVEIIASYLVHTGESMKYDGWAIALTIILSFFAMTMAGAEFTITHLSQLKVLF